jgi:predicted transcriptional regulator/DNA-binding XRE family transcriptional regulator
VNEPNLLGAKIRALRRRERLTQAQMAERLGVSASYLNLIENNRRPLTAALLLKVAEQFKLDLGSFAPADDARLVADLREVFADPIFEDSGVTRGDLGELAASQPAAARAVLQLYRAYRSARESAETFAEKISDGAAELIGAASPTEEINDLLQRRGNYFPEIESAAEALWKKAAIQNDDVYGRLAAWLEEEHGIDVQTEQAQEGQPMRRYDPKRRVITLSEVLPPRSRRFQLAHQVGLIEYRDVFDGLGLEDEVSSPGARAMIPVVLANYFAAAVLMPYAPFLEAARATRHDIELLAHRYRTSFEQVCHRLTTLRRPGAEGIPFHFLRIDVAGNISKRFSASGISMPRFSGACPRWNVHSAFLTPGMIRVQLSRTPDGITYFCLARTVRRDSGGYNTPHNVHSICVGCEVRYARQLVYSDGVDLDNLDAATPVGVTCRTCDQMDCEQRVAPPVHHPLRIDENVRGLSFYAPVVTPERLIRADRSEIG